MTIPSPWTTREEIVEDRSVFDARPDIGPESGLLARMMRYFQGNPSTQQSVSNASTVVAAVLPDDARARTAVITVLSHSCVYRIDAAVPNVNSDPSLQVGTIVTLFGRDSIKGFTFIAGANGPATLSVQYYD